MSKKLAPGMCLLCDEMRVGMDGREGWVMDGWVGAVGGWEGWMDGQTDGRAEWTDRRADGQMNGRTEGQTDGRTYGRMEGWADVEMDGWTDRQTVGWKDGRMERWTDGHWSGRQTHRQMDSCRGNKDCRRSISAILTWDIKISARLLNTIGN